MTACNSYVKNYSALKKIFQAVIILWAMPCFAQPGDTARIPLVLPGTQKLETADFNFDGYADYRIGTVKYTAKFDYFIYSPTKKKYEKDTFLSSLDGAAFEFDKKAFQGYKLTHIDRLTSQTDLYINRDGGFVLIQRTICTSPYEQAERTDCSVYEMINGRLVFKEFIKGKE